MSLATVKLEGVTFHVEYSFDAFGDLYIDRIETAKGEDLTALADYLDLTDLVADWDCQHGEHLGWSEFAQVAL